MNTEIKNAKITGTQLGREGHGIMTCNLQLEYECGAQSFGGYSFSSDGRGTAYAIEFIERILDTVGVESWEDLVGKHVRVEAEHCKVHRIGHFMKNKWFDPAKDLDQYK